MEAQGGAGSPDDTKKGQNLLKPSMSGELSKEHSQHPRIEEDRVIPGHTPSLLHVTDRRRNEVPKELHQHLLHSLPRECLTKPLSSVSSLEVHFDLLDLTELTDMSDQELTEVFVDSDEENPESPAGYHHYPGRGSYLRSPSWNRCSKPEQSHDRKHHSDSDSTESCHKLERPKKP
ncbi:dysbindin domain-containing protein 1 isoform X1 [Tachysurus fulvidraco]|uniref:dysbindin domain-containing protein 1 isoform X1 n=1 Tax=Tachysurus fulvidraco TaxID=1234273 RepID=UPI000F504866|nr:dysbindin domain-containing protein 1 isoform X1 [Tachysurus fulvidraco]